MPSSLDALKARAMDEVLRRLYRLGYTPKSVEEAQRDTIWWVYARVQAVLNRRPLDRGLGIAWTSAGYAELVPVEIPRPGPGRVSALVDVSAVSPGTERAQYLRLPNTAVGVLGRPGYSCAGTVRALGPGVEGLAVGDRVAVAGSAHASMVTVPAASVFPVPDSVDLSAASLIQLGIICGQGVALGDLRSGEPFGVVGAGAIGALTGRLAGARGDLRAVIARSDAKREDALRGGAAEFLRSDADAERIAGLDLPLVFEATGNPDALAVAAAAAGKGGRIVLIGSPRGVTRDLPLEHLREKNLEVVGAHVDTVDLQGSRSGEDLRRRRGEEFVAALAGGGMFLDDLAGPARDPREAALFYEELAARRDLVGAHFDWSTLRADERQRRGHLLSPPNVIGAGMDASRPLPAPRRGRKGLLSLGDQLAGAEGRLRLGLIGCGDISVHNAAGIGTAPNCELVACFDPVQRLAADLAGRYGARAMTSAEELLDLSEVDAVVVAVPHHLHAPIAEAALAAGKHVVVEKPQANSLLAGQRMGEAASAAGRTLSVCFPQRYDPAVVLTRRLIEAGAIGRFEGAAIRLYLDKSPAYWLGGFSGRTQSDWRRSKERAGGGVLIMNLSHHLDLIRHLGGEEAVAVQATGGGIRDGSEIEDSISIGISFANGAVANVSGYSAVRGTTEEEVSLWGQAGHVLVSPAPRIYTLRAIDGLRTSRWQTLGSLPPQPIRAIYFARLATAISAGEPPDVGVDDGLAVQAMIEAAYRSTESNVVEHPAELLVEASR